MNACTLKRIDRLAKFQANRFSRTTGIEVEDLIQEARMAAVKSLGSYDSDKASLDTYVNTCIYRRMCDISKSQSRRIRPVQMPVDDDGIEVERADDGPSPEDLAIFRDLIAQLPEDAMTVVHMILGDAVDVIGLSDLSRLVRERLGWSQGRVRRAIFAVQYALRTGGMYRTMRAA